MKDAVGTDDTTEWHFPRKESSWLKLREGDITATAAAALFGVSPYQTPFELFHTLAGTLTVEFEESERMRWGKRLESAIAHGVCEDNGWQIVDSRRFMYAKSKICPGMGASPDFLIRDPAQPEKGIGLLEIKNVDFFIAGRDWDGDEAPPHIEFQLQHQMGATGFGWGAVAGLIGGNTTRIIQRDADAEVIGEIMRRIQEMHAWVKAGTPPPPDYLADFETIRTLYRDAEPAKSFNLDLPDPDADLDATKLETLIETAHDASVKAKLADEDKKRAQAELLEYIADTETVFGERWKVSATTTHKEARTVEYKPSTFRNLRITKRKQKNEAGK